MSKRRFFTPVALAVASTAVIAACSSDTPTSPMTASLSLTAVAPAIGLSSTTLRLCYPGGGSTRVCWPSGFLSIRNTGGGTLNWTATKSRTWLKISPRLGTAPSTMKVWVDPTGLLRGTYSGRITVWATGATNSPQTVVVYFTRR
jgi:BACON domain-containing protein